MKEKLKAAVEELEVVATIAVYAAICGAAWDFGKHVLTWIFR